LPRANDPQVRRISTHGHETPYSIKILIAIEPVTVNQENKRVVLPFVNGGEGGKYRINRLASGE
jgi:hypothetical protein